MITLIERLVNRYGIKIKDSKSSFLICLICIPVNQAAMKAIFIVIKRMKSSELNFTFFIIIFVKKNKIVTDETVNTISSMIHPFKN